MVLALLVLPFGQYLYHLGFAMSRDLEVSVGNRCCLLKVISSVMTIDHVDSILAPQLSSINLSRSLRSKMTERST